MTTMKSKRTTATGMLGAILLLAAGCGGSGGGGGGGGPITHILVQNVSDSVNVGDCVAIEGPYTVGTGSTSFNLVDTPTGVGSDSMEVVILPDSVWLSQGCNFTVSETVVDDQNVPSDSGEGPISDGTYDFVVACDNAIDDCFFNLSWSATY
jgi:hypothetical protein